MDLHSRAVALGTLAAATAGAVTVGLVAGVAHAQVTTSSSTSGTGNGSTTTSTSGQSQTTQNTDDDQGVNTVPQNITPQGGSNGS